MSGIIGGIKGSMKKKFVAGLNGDPNWSNVVLLLSGDDLVDRSITAKTISASTNPVQTSVKKYGTGAMYFNGVRNVNKITVNDHPDVNLNGVSDWTIECWLNPDGDYSKWNVFVDKRNTAASYVCYLRLSSGVVGFYNQQGNFESSTVLTTGVWSHVAYVYRSNTLYMFVNGTQVYSNNTVVIPADTGNLSIGETNAAFTGEQYKGYIDDLRITKGLARYTSNFTSPSTALPTSAGGPSSQIAYTTPGTYNWVAPAGVTSVSVVAVGAGSSASGYFGIGGAGGALAYKNNIPVSPGTSYTLVVGAGGGGGTGQSFQGVAGGLSSFAWSSATLIANGGGAPTASGPSAGTSTGGAPGGTYDGGGNGGGCPGPYSTGASGGATTSYFGSGGGGAGGYSGNGGNGGGSNATGNGTYIQATAGTGGAGGGGGGCAQTNTAADFSDCGGGGVGLLGQGASGAAGAAQTTTAAQGYAGGGGSGGSNGVAPSNTTTPGNGGGYGGGGGSTHGNNASCATGSGAGGAVRIIWGTGRSFPSTNTQDF
jgi:hypothetical protein